MAYRLEPLLIIPGGLDLLAPGDQKTPQGDSLDLTDFFAGAQGKLEQAPQFGLTLSIPSATTLDSLCQADTRVYYGGAGALGQVGRGNIDSGYDGAPLGLISLAGFCWVMNRSKQRRDNGTTVSDWTPLAPTGAPGVTDAGATTGTGPNNGDGAKLHLYEDSYRMTWVIPGLGETNPSVSVLLTPAVDLSSTSITQGAATPPAGATGFNIYRQIPAYGGASLDANTAPYLLNTDGPIALGATFIDTGNAIDGQDDTSLLRFGQILEADHDAAPPARVIANQAYNGRIVVASSAANPNRIWWTPALQPAFFRGSGDAYDGDWLDVGTDSGDAILAITVRAGMCVIYRQHSIWRHLGDFGAPDAVLEPIVPNQGVTGPRAVVSTSVGDYFISNDGVYKFNNDNSAKLSLKVEPLFRGLPTENFIQLGTTFRSQMAIGHRNGRLWVTYPNVGGSGGASLVYHIETDRWFAAGGVYYAYLDTGTQLLGAASGGLVLPLENSYTAGATTLAYQSSYLDADRPDREKTWADLVLTHNTQGATLTIIIRTNRNATANDSFTLITFSSTTLTRTIFPLLYPATYAVGALQGKPIRARNLSVRITGAGAATNPVTIDTPLLLHYYLEARRGRTFDSGIIDHGLEGVGTVDAVEIDIDSSPGIVGMTVSSDIPGGVMTIRSPGTVIVPASTGRQVLRFVLSAPIDGRRFRYQLQGNTEFQVYGFRVRLLPVGVYVDGSQADSWVTGSIVTGV